MQTLRDHLSKVPDELKEKYQLSTIETQTKDPMFVLSTSCLNIYHVDREEVEKRGENFEAVCLHTTCPGTITC